MNPTKIKFHALKHTLELNGIPNAATLPIMAFTGTKRELRVTIWDAIESYVNIGVG